MDPIAVITVNIHSNRAALEFGTDFSQEAIKGELAQRIQDGQRIHILANNLSDMDLYVQISYLIRELFPFSKITLVTDNQVFLNSADSFNHLRERKKLIRFDNNVEHQESVFDECVLLEQMSDYSLLCDQIISGKYEDVGILIPAGPELKQAAIDYIWECKSMSYPVDYSGKELLHHIGLDYINLRKLFSFDSKYRSFCEEEYDWNQFFGRDPEIDFWQCIKNEDCEIRARFDKKTDEMCTKAFDVIETAIKKYQSASLMLSALDCDNEDGLYKCLLNEIRDGGADLRETNRETYLNLQAKEEKTRKERGGIWGRRREALDDLLESADFFLNQRYEIHREAAIKETYDRLLQWFRDRDVLHAKGKCDNRLSKVFEENSLYETFSEYYFQTFRMKGFFTESALKTMRERIVGRARETGGNTILIELKDGSIQQFVRSSIQIIPQEITCRFLKADSNIFVEMIADGAAQRCLVIEKDRVVLKFFREIDKSSKEYDSIAELLRELEFLERVALVPVMEEEYAIENGMWQKLISNERFISNLRECLYRINKINSYRNELQCML